MTGVDKYISLHRISGKPLQKYLHPWFLSCFQKQQENSIMMLASTQ
jgi:hypothetical protein